VWFDPELQRGTRRPSVALPGDTIYCANIAEMNGSSCRRKPDSPSEIPLELSIERRPNRQLEPLERGGVFQHSPLEQTKRNIEGEPRLRPQRCTQTGPHHPGIESPQERRRATSPNLRQPEGSATGKLSRINLLRGLGALMLLQQTPLSQASGELCRRKGDAPGSQLMRALGGDGARTVEFATFPELDSELSLLGSKHAKKQHGRV
jgi:hypothetical protein